MSNESASGPGNVDMNRVEAYLERRLPGILTALSRKVNIAKIDADSGAVGAIDIGKVELGDTTVDKLTLQNTSATLSSGRALMSNVRVNLELQFTLDWWIDIGIYDRSGSENMGSLNFNVNVGDIRVPSLEEIDLNIPTVTVNDLQASMSPITNLPLDGATFKNAVVQDTAAPSAGFSLSGMSVGDFSLSSAQLPATTSRQATIQQFAPEGEVVLPNAQLGPIQMPSTSINNVSSNNIMIDAVANRRGLSGNFGVFGVTIWVRPIAHTNIGSMVLQDAALSAVVNSADIQNARLNVQVRDVKMTDLDLQNIKVTDISG